jgi:membrane-associated phospholipid phosphatase
MKFRLYFIALFFIPVFGFAQKDTVVKKLDSLSLKEDSLHTGKNNNTNPQAYNDSTRIKLSNYFLLLGNDFKQQFTFPFHAKKRDWLRFGGFVGALGLLSLADEPISQSMVKLNNSSSFVSSVGHNLTNFGANYEVYTLAGFAAYGFIFKKDKIKTTFYLATQSYVMGLAVSSVFKFLSKRQRPDYIPPGAEPDPNFHGPFYKFSNQAAGTLSSSFPSGHTTAVFAAATVYAMEYRNHPWIPIFSYSFASLVALTRLTENKHWPTDILFGAAIGFLSGKQVVNNYHRYMKIKQPERPVKPKKGTLSFGIFPMLPGVTYSF